MTNNFHIPGMVKEVLNFLQLDENSIVVDATFGFGGHSKEFLKFIKNGKIIGFEKDEEIFNINKEWVEKNKNILLFNRDFVEIDDVLKEIGCKEIDAIFFDFGLSSYHIEQSARGFSFKRNEELDMRFSKNNNKPLKEYLKTLSKKEIEKILKNFGEEPFYRKISRNIVKQREKENIVFTSQLHQIITRSVPYNLRNQSSKRVFQAFRIFINRELEKISIALEKSYPFLKKNGRIVCLCYHSLEDRIVKNFLKQKSFTILTKKPVRPSSEEIEKNPRIRSCKLRAGIK